MAIIVNVYKNKEFENDNCHFFIWNISINNRGVLMKHGVPVVEIQFEGTVSHISFLGKSYPFQKKEIIART